MGIALWGAGGLLAWILARTIPAGRKSGRWLAEAALAIATALLLGLIATALDFGGWKELDWRAAVFAFFGALLALGCFRLVTVPRVQ